VGVFVYSPEEGTPAAALPNQVPARVRKDRHRRAMLHQQGISLAINQEFVGKTLTMLVEGLAEERPERAKKGAAVELVLVGRSYRHAPEIDGLVFAHGKAAVGQMVAVRVTEATEYDLWGTVEQGAGSRE
jgi:ribosomal protein S12 methylthiotransferase